MSQPIGQLRYDLEQVADEADVGDLEYRGFLVLVDGDDGLRILHAREVLDRAGNADRDVDVGRNDLSGLADLIVVPRIARINRRPACIDAGAELVGERVEKRVELLAAAECPTAEDDHADAGQLWPLAL